MYQSVERSVRYGVTSGLLSVGLLYSFSGGSAVLAQSSTAPDARPVLVLDAGGHTAPVRKLLFRRQGRELITVSDDKTIRIWDVATGEPLRVLRPPIGPGAEGKLYAAALSPDENTLAVAGNTSRQGLAVIYLISLTAGEMTGVLEGHTQAISGLDFSPQGRLLASCGADRTARIWELATGRCLQVLRGHRGPVQDVAFAPDGRRCVTAGLDGAARIWATATGTQLTTLTGHTAEVAAVAWNPDGQTIATGSADESIRIWSADGKLQTTFAASVAGIVGALHYSRDGGLLIAAHWDRRGEGGPIASVIDVRAGTQKVKFTGHSNTLFDAILSPDQALAASTGGNDSETYIWRLADGSQVHRLAARSRTVWAAGWDANRALLAWGNSNAGLAAELGPPLERSFDLHWLELGQPVTAGNAAAFYRAQLSQGTRRLGLSGRTGVEVTNAGQASVVLQPDDAYERSHDTVKSYTFLGPDRVAVGSAFGLRLYEAGTGKLVRRFRGHTSEVLAVSPTTDNRYLLSASSDMTLRVWDPDVEEPVVSLFFAGDDWIAWTPQGYYAASPGGERLMGWHVNQGTDRLAAFYPAGQFRKQFYKPELIPLVLPAGGVGPALDVLGEGAATTIADNLPPRVEILSPTEPSSAVSGDQIEVRVQAEQTGRHPVTSLQILVDGRPLTGPSSVHRPAAAATRASHVFQVPLSRGVTHSIQARADNAVSYALSKPIEVLSRLPGSVPPPSTPGSTSGSAPPLPLEHEPTPEELSQRPKLYVLAIGISEYQDDGLRLNFADDDARRVVDALSQGGQSLFSQVEVRLVLDSEATQRGILEGLLWLNRQMTQHDIGILSYSGHGARDEAGAFYLVPVEHRSESPLLVSGVSEEQIKRLLQTTPGRVIVLLDACHAGVLGGDTRKSIGSITDDIVRDLSTDDYGLIVMASAMGRELSLELPALEGGCFTLAVTAGLAGEADSNSDGYVYFTELDAFVSQRVKELSHGRQHPVTAKPTTIRPFPLVRTVRP